jgi:hypothetical protein
MSTLVQILAFDGNMLLFGALLCHYRKCRWTLLCQTLNLICIGLETSQWATVGVTHSWVTWDGVQLCFEIGMFAALRCTDLKRMMIVYGAVAGFWAGEYYVADMIGLREVANNVMYPQRVWYSILADWSLAIVLLRRLPLGASLGPQQTSPTKP